MRPSLIIVLSMFCMEVFTNLHVFIPSNMTERIVVDGMALEQYDETVLDPWMIRMTTLSMASAIMLLLFTKVKPDQHARNYLRAWALFFVSQGVQKMCGLNVAESLCHVFSGRDCEFDLPYDLSIMLIFVMAAWAVNRLGLEVKYPNLRIEWSQHRSLNKHK